jgi:hypothetical protein
MLFKYIDEFETTFETTLDELWLDHHHSAPISTPDHSPDSPGRTINSDLRTRFPYKHEWHVQSPYKHEWAGDRMTTTALSGRTRPVTKHTNVLQI